MGKGLGKQQEADGKDHTAHQAADDQHGNHVAKIQILEIKKGFFDRAC